MSDVVIMASLSSVATLVASAVVAWVWKTGKALFIEKMNENRDLVKTIDGKLERYAASVSAHQEQDTVKFHTAEVKQTATDATVATLTMVVTALIPAIASGRQETAELLPALLARVTPEVTA